MHLFADGGQAETLCIPGGGSLHPTSAETLAAGQHFVHMSGKVIFTHAVRNLASACQAAMDSQGLTAKDIDLVVAHQANLRIIDATAERMGLPKEKVMINIEKYGNTTAGTLPLCLWEWEPKLKKGDNIVLAAFGGGFTWGATLLKWAYDG